MSSKKSVDGMSKNPAHATTALTKYIDWQELKRQFILQTEFTSPQQWLYSEKGWTVKKIKSGNTQRKIVGWGSERAAIQQQKLEASTKAAIEEERKLVPDIRRAKALLIAGIIKDLGNWNALNSYDKKVCYEILKIELREPTNVKDLRPADARDPVEALLEEYGLMQDGEVIIDDDPSSDQRLISGADSGAAENTDSKTSAQVAQD